MRRREKGSKRREGIEKKKNHYKLREQEMREEIKRSGERWIKRNLKEKRKRREIKKGGCVRRKNVKTGGC